jgi:hypothetical protein
VSTQPVNHDLCFSTITTILDYVFEDPSPVTDDLIKQFEVLQFNVDLKLHDLKARFDNQGKMGSKPT